MIPFVVPLVGIVVALLTTQMRSIDPPPPAQVESAALVCEPPATDAVAPVRPGESWTPLSPVQRNLATQLIAIFENRERTLQYAYVENIDDGRGFTSGIVGFTTGTGDARLVIDRYREMAERQGAAVRGNIARYLPELERLDRLERSDPARATVFALGGYEDAWRAAAEDPLFRAAQDSVASDLYYRPALQLADVVGIRSGLGRALLWDAIIQHGGGYDPDGLPAMLALTREQEGYPTSWEEEWDWLDRFLEVRNDVLYCAHGEGTREAWRASRTRVDVYRQLLENGNMDLAPPLQFQLDSRGWTIEPN